MDTKLDTVRADLADLDPVLVLREVYFPTRGTSRYEIQLIPDAPALQFYSLDEVTSWIAADRAAGA